MKFLNNIIDNIISWAGTIIFNNTTTGDIAEFKLNNVSKAKIDNNGKYIGDVDQLDGQHGTYYLDYNNFNNKPDLNKIGTKTLVEGTPIANQVLTYNGTNVVYSTPITEEDLTNLGNIYESKTELNDILHRLSMSSKYILPILIPASSWIFNSEINSYVAQIQSQSLDGLSNLEVAVLPQVTDDVNSYYSIYNNITDVVLLDVPLSIMIVSLKAPQNDFTILLKPLELPVVSTGNLG